MWTTVWHTWLFLCFVSTHTFAVSTRKWWRSQRRRRYSLCSWRTRDHYIEGSQPWIIREPQLGRVLARRRERSINSVPQSNKFMSLDCHLLIKFSISNQPLPNANIIERLIRILLEQNFCLKFWREKNLKNKFSPKVNLYICVISPIYTYT